MPGKKKNPQAGAGLQIGGNVSVTHGDVVAGDKNIKLDRGSVFVGGNVEGSNLVTGNHNQVGIQNSDRDALFNDLLTRIDQRPNTSPEDREDLKTSVAEIKSESEKGEQADETFLTRRFRNIKRIAPDIAEVLLATLANPMAGFAAIVKKVAAHAQRSASS